MSGAEDCSCDAHEPDLSIPATPDDTVAAGVPAGAAPPPPGEARFVAFQHRNFRLFWAGNLVSLVGTIAQQTAQGWLVRTLTPNPLVVTTVSACGSIPVLVLTLFAGVMADRLDKRRTLLATNITASQLALLLAALVYSGHVQVWHVAVVALALGVVNAFDIPVRQSFNIEMVGREALPNAIALNSSAFNAARVAGPAVGGLLLHSIGTAGCFVINALSFVAIIVGLSKMRLPPHRPAGHSPRFKEVHDGYLFVCSHETLRLVMILVAVASIFALSFTPLLPIFARDVFGSDARGFSLLLTCNGAGALGAAITTAVSGSMKHKGKRLLAGCFLFCLSVLAFAAAPTMPLACLFLFAAGWSLLTFLMSANTLVQTLSPHDMRGRVFSLYSLALIGTTPIGSLLVGAAAGSIGPRRAVEAGALLATAFTVAVYLRFRALWKEN